LILVKKKPNINLDQEEPDLMASGKAWFKSTMTKYNPSSPEKSGSKLANSATHGQRRNFSQKLRSQVDD
jgi:hypothetical protein